MAPKDPDAAPVDKSLCEAKGQPCILNFLCTPFVLCYQAHKIYACVCLWTYLDRSLTGICCCICRCLCKSCYRFTDKKFPANATSIGDWKGKSEKEVAKEIEWQRAEDYFEKKLTDGQKQDGVRLKLFEGGVEPKDVAQGGLGDCWLISALACMAEHEGLLRTCFITQEFNERGKYQVRLYDGRVGKWTVVTVDDSMPVNKETNKLLFAQPKGHDSWSKVPSDLCAGGHMTRPPHAPAWWLPPTAQAAPTDPGAQPEPLGSLPWPQYPASRPPQS